MNLTIKATILAALKSNEADLLNFLKNVSDDDFFNKPSESIWSIAENLEHIILTEAYTIEKLQRVSTDNLEIQSRHPNGKVEYLVLDRNRKVDAPEELVPKNSFENKASGVLAFQKVRAASEVFLQNLKRPLREIGFPHFTLGMLNGENWGTFIPAHCERHLKQMREFKMSVSRSDLFELIKNSEIRLLSFLENISEEDFLSKPSESVWSVAELVEHIILVETAVSKNLYQLSKVKKEVIESNLLNEQVTTLVTKKIGKVKSPDMFVPKGIFKDKTSAIEAFKKLRMETEHFVRKIEMPLAEISFPHFVIGMMNGENWLAFIAGHCERHILQMEDRIV